MPASSLHSRRKVTTHSDCKTNLDRCFRRCGHSALSTLHSAACAQAYFTHRFVRDFCVDARTGGEERIHLNASMTLYKL